MDDKGLIIFKYQNAPEAARFSPTPPVGNWATGKDSYAI